MKWNSPEARRLFENWKLGDNEPYQLLEEVDHKQVNELTVAARGFLKHRDKTIHAFSDDAVRTVRGVTRLSSITLSQNVDARTHTFTRTFEPKDMRAILREQFDPDAQIHIDDIEDPYAAEDSEFSSALANTEMFAAYEHDYDLKVRQDTVFENVQLPEQSNVSYIALDPTKEPIRQEGYPLLVEDYLVLRTIMSVEGRLGNK
jgi:hypothetical protein